MNRVSTWGSIWCLSFVLSPAAQTREADFDSAASIKQRRDILEALQTFWGQDFDSNYAKYMRGSDPTVLLIPREEMRKIAAARVDYRERDGETTQGITAGDPPNVKIFVVYDGLSPFLVAKAIIHELGHLELRGKDLSRNDEEAYVRKVVDTGFFEKVFGRQWLETTVSELLQRVVSVEKGGRVYQGYTPEAVELLYQEIRKMGTVIKKAPLHDAILGNMVFILTNSEERLAAALDFEDDQR